MTNFYARFTGDFAGAEQWTTGYHFQGDGALTDFTTACGTALASWWLGSGTDYDGIGLYMSTTCHVSSLDAYQLDATTGKATAAAKISIANPGTDSGFQMPTEVAMVASIRTATPGPHGRGRSYLPSPTTASLLASGRLSGTVAQSLADTVAGTLAACGDAGFAAVLFTPAGITRLVTSVDVGDVFDAQRRRRDKLVETRYTASL